MSIKYPHLATIGDLPLSMPEIDPHTESLVFEQPISQRFRHRTIVTAGITICFFALFMYFAFPYITGTKQLSPNRRNGNLYLIFYLSFLAIPYLGWQVARIKTTKNFIRKVLITNTHEISINGQLLSDAKLNRGNVIIRSTNKTRKIEAIWIQSAKRSYLIAAKDLPEDLDQIEAMIPIQCSLVETETEMKGVL